MEIAKRGYNKVQAKYSGARFWKTLFDKIGLYDRLNEVSKNNVNRQLMEEVIELNVKLQEAEREIEEMQSSKFWKLQNAWVEFKKYCSI